MQAGRRRDRALSRDADRQFGLLASGPLGPALLNARGEALHLAGSLAVDRYGGKTRVQLRMVDAAVVGAGR